MDIASLVGLLLGIGLMIFGIVSGELGVAALKNFWDPASVLITFGGAFAAMLASNSIKDYIAALKSFTLIFKTDKADDGEIIKSIIDLSNVARKEGLLALEEAANSLEDVFLKKVYY